VGKGSGYFRTAPPLITSSTVVVKVPIEPAVISGFWMVPLM